MPETLTLADVIRAAITVLRCDHRFPINPPDGSIYGPGHCIRCGISYQYEKPVADWMVEPLAAWLVSAAGVVDECEAASLPNGGHAPTAHRGIPEALAAACAITGRTP